jgi:hypothetical protein
LPDAVSGNWSQVNQSVGDLWCAIAPRQCSISFSAHPDAFGDRRTTAATTSPHFSSGAPNTATSVTSGRVEIADHRLIAPGLDLALYADRSHLQIDRIRNPHFDIPKGLSNSVNKLCLRVVDARLRDNRAEFGLAKDRDYRKAKAGQRSS